MLLLIDKGVFDDYFNLSYKFEYNNLYECSQSADLEEKKFNQKRNKIFTSNPILNLKIIPNIKK